ncbi:succinate dehydrogenase [Pseudothauera nasutitermitis]|uniref:Succinate dehydrogenase n=1 Tax=Pseudothauera nasutitermitis TaxID=2565930 RepID=A0A4S4B0E1_9RHOO|nr:succinate dehydrogenase [Pseudothauera nasutitermitis]
MRSADRHQAYLAFLGHRISGLALAFFLPLHFLVLGLALEGQARLDGLLAFAAMPAVKAAEWALVVLLALHLGLGLRLLAVEFLAWPGARGARLHWIGRAAGFALSVGLVFLWSILRG